MINEECKWIYKEVYIEVIILNNLQKLTLNVFKLIKYNTILEMLWLYIIICSINSLFSLYLDLWEQSIFTTKKLKWENLNSILQTLF